MHPRTFGAKLDVMCNKHSASNSGVISPTPHYFLRFVHFQLIKRLARSLIMARNREDLQGFLKRANVESRLYVKLGNLPSWYKYI